MLESLVWPRTTSCIILCKWTVVVCRFLYLSISFVSHHTYCISYPLACINPCNMKPNERFLPEASFELRILSLAASVCLCVRLCAITCPPFNTRHQTLAWSAKTLEKYNWDWLNWTENRDWLLKKSKFTPFWASPHRNSLPVQVRISKLEAIMHLNTIKILLYYF